MYIAVVPNRNSPPAILLREGWREGNKTRQRTVANLSDWPQQKIESLRRLLHDEPMVSLHDRFTTQKSLPHGHVEAVLEMIRKLELQRLISSQPCRERDLVVAMIVQRLLAPVSKLATTRQWHSTTLAEELGVAEATEDDLYAAMDWLGERQERIEKRVICRKGAWCSMTCRAVSMRGVRARWRSLATIAMTSRACPSLSTES